MKLQRSHDDYHIAGVCGGLANNFRWDSGQLRIVRVLATILILITPVCFCGCGKAEKNDSFDVDAGDETPQHKTARWEKEAHEEILKKCTNQVSGISKIIELNLFDEAGTHPQRWTARVTLD
jgi:phage shock protein PspC (stress-responsive transcriptional regulator)